MINEETTKPKGLSAEEARNKPKCIERTHSSDEEHMNKFLRGKVDEWSLKLKIAALENRDNSPRGRN